jgi:Restriction endonuclease
MRFLRATEGRDQCRQIYRVHVFAQFFQCIIPADGGVDLGLTKDGQRYLVQCKHWLKRQVGVTVVRESCVSPCSKRVPNQELEFSLDARRE